MIQNQRNLQLTEKIAWSIKKDSGLLSEIKVCMRKPIIIKSLNKISKPMKKLQQK